MVKPVTPTPKPTNSLASEEMRGRPGTQPQLIQTATAVQPAVTIGLATSDQYPQPDSASATLTMLPTRFDEMSIIARRRNCMARRISAECCVDIAVKTNVIDSASPMLVSDGSPNRRAINPLLPMSSTVRPRLIAMFSQNNELISAWVM